MKRNIKIYSVLPMMLLLSFLLWACEKFELKSNDTFSVDKGCASVVYQSKIGNDKASAIDSIKRIYVRDYPDLLADSICLQPLNVDFPHDNRSSWLLTVKEKDLISPVYIGFDVVDSKGNHYRYAPCED